MNDIYKTLYNLGPETKKVFNLIQKNGPQSKNNLQLLTNMKLTTLNRVMEPLEEQGWVIQSSIGESTGGRKPVLYDVNAGKAYMAGVDISRTYTRVVITDLKMATLYQLQFDMDKSHTPSKTVALIDDIIHGGLKTIKAGPDRLLGVGIGAVGPMDTKKGIIINPVNFNAPGWKDVPIKAMLQKKIRLPLFLDNGANTAAMAEMLLGKGKSFNNLVYINCGVGIRTGAISARTIVRTVNDAEDAFGHMVIDVDGEACSCGNFGCIECYSSIPAITNRFIAELKKGRSSMLSQPINTINYIDICSAANGGDGLAQEILTGSAVILGTGLANFINLLNPGLVILSGPLIRHSNLFYETCIEVALRKCYKNHQDRIIFSKGGYFKDNAIAMGSAVMVLEHCLNNAN